MNMSPFRCNMDGLSLGTCTIQSLYTKNSLPTRMSNISLVPVWQVRRPDTLGGQYVSNLTYDEYDFHTIVYAGSPICIG